MSVPPWFRFAKGVMPAPRFKKVDNGFGSICKQLKEIHMSDVNNKFRFIGNHDDVLALALKMADNYGRFENIQVDRSTSSINEVVRAIDPRTIPPTTYCPFQFAFDPESGLGSSYMGCIIVRDSGDAWMIELSQSAKWESMFEGFDIDKLLGDGAFVVSYEYEFDMGGSDAMSWLHLPHGAGDAGWTCSDVVSDDDRMYGEYSYSDTPFFAAYYRMVLGKSLPPNGMYLFRLLVSNDAKAFEEIMGEFPGCERLLDDIDLRKVFNKGGTETLIKALEACDGQHKLSKPAEVFAYYCGKNDVAAVKVLLEKVHMVTQVKKAVMRTVVDLEENEASRAVIDGLGLNAA